MIHRHLNTIIDIRAYGIEGTIIIYECKGCKGIKHKIIRDNVDEARKKYQFKQKKKHRANTL